MHDAKRLEKLEQLGVRQPPPLTDMVARYWRLALDFDCYQVGLVAAGEWDERACEQPGEWGWQPGKLGLPG
jgi:hypothetical protein